MPPTDWKWKNRSRFATGTATFLAFILAGSIPLVAYLFPGSLEGRFPVATFLTLLTLFCVGSLRTFVTKAGWLKSGLEMLVLAAAAGVAYGVGAFIASLT